MARGIMRVDAANDVPTTMKIHHRNAIGFLWTIDSNWDIGIFEFQNMIFGFAKLSVWNLLTHRRHARPKFFGLHIGQLDPLSLRCPQKKLRSRVQSLSIDAQWRAHQQAKKNRRKSKKILLHILKTMPFETSLLKKLIFCCGRNVRIDAHCNRQGLRHLISYDKKNHDVENTAD